MPKVPTYAAGRLASSQVGVPAQDQSGVIVGNAVTNLAGRAMDIFGDMLAKQKVLYNDSQKAKLFGEYTSQMMEGTEKIRVQYSADPEKAVSELKSYREKLKEDFLQGVDNSLIRQELSTTFTGLNTREMVQDFDWQIRQTNKLTKMNYADRMTQDAKFLGGPVSYLNYIDKVDGLLQDKGKIVSAFDNPEEGLKYVEQGLEANTRAFVYGKIDRGEMFEVSNLLASGKFDPFITPDVKLELGDKIDSAIKGDRKRSKLMAAANVSSAVFGVSQNLMQKPLPELEDELSEFRYLEKQAAVSGKTEEAEKYQQAVDIYSLIRDAKLEDVAATAKDDPVVKGSFLSDFQKIVATDDGVTTLTSTFEDVVNFQKKAAQAYYDGQLSQETFQKWMTLTQAAISEGVTGRVVNRRFGGIPQPGFAMESDKINPEVLSKNTAVKKGMRQILAGFDNKKDSPQDAVQALEFFMDDLYRQTDGNLGTVQDLTDDALKTIVEHAKRKAMSLKLGVSGDYQVGSVIQLSSGSWKVIGFKENGEYILQRAQ